MARMGCTGACCSNDVKKHRLCKHRDRNKSPDVGVFRVAVPLVQAWLLAHTLFRLRTNADVSLFCWSETRWISNVAFSTPLFPPSPHIIPHSPHEYLIFPFNSTTCLRSISRSIGCNFFDGLLVNSRKKRSPSNPNPNNRSIQTLPRRNKINPYLICSKTDLFQTGVVSKFKFEGPRDSYSSRIEGRGGGAETRVVFSLFYTGIQGTPCIQRS